MSNVELANLYWSAAGINPVEADISPYDFRDRVESAARAGFKGIGVWHTDLEHILVSRTLRDMKAILDDNGVGVFEVEFLADWFVSGGGRRRESNARKRRLFEASAALNAHHVKVGDFYNTPVLMPQVVESFAALCKEAESFGATIGFEFMASAMLTNLTDSLAMVEEADAKNGGIIVDIVHVVSQGISYEDVSRIPGRFLISAELNDGALPGSPLYDPARGRRFCGEGDFDIQGFIAAIRQTGSDGPWAVEVISPELTHLPQDELNQRGYDTTMTEFAKAGK
jgi:sugar phosphate isomerase/epimerase